jgi:hypothetical protein
LKLDHLKSIGKFEFSLLYIVDYLALLVIFENLLESNWTIVPKEKVFLITCSMSVQICKKSGAWEIFVSMVQIELYEPVSRHAVLRVWLTVSYL